jgi:Fe-Mn family superoxide dismutase
MNPTRRDMLAMTVPAALLGMTGLSAFAQDTAAAASPLTDLFKGMYADGEYRLPKLPYAYDALEPHIDAATMELHHSRHHNAYVTNLNRAMKEMAELNVDDADMHHIEGLQRDISFNAGGHVMHTLFWGIMAPNAGGAPVGAIADAINATFGSYERFAAYFSKVAISIKGSGWAVLALEPFGQRLVTYAMGDQDTRLISGAIPLLAVDVWEHAYYLKYQNRRGDYVKAWFNTIHWPTVDAIFRSHQHPLAK